MSDLLKKESASIVDYIDDPSHDFLAYGFKFDLKNEKNKDFDLEELKNLYKKLPQAQDVRIRIHPLENHREDQEPFFSIFIKQNIELTFIDDAGITPFDISKYVDYFSNESKFREIMEKVKTQLLLLGATNISEMDFFTYSRLHEQLY